MVFGSNKIVSSGSCVYIVKSDRHIRRRVVSKVSQILLGATILIVACLIDSSLCTSMSKDTISWDELGVSLASKNPSTSSKDVKIFVSPQRRSNKGYGEVDTSSSDSSSANSVLTSNGDQQTVSFYVQPTNSNDDYSTNTNQHSASMSANSNNLNANSNGGATVQLQSPQSQAYSALSASLASLKSRLNRGSLGLATHSSTGQNQLPLSTSTSYETQMPQQQQQQQQQSTSYINVNQASGSGHDLHGYQQTNSANSNDNKTIVLAIPAKINFLTDNKQQSSSVKQSSYQPDITRQTPRIPSTIIDNSGQDGISYTIDSSGIANNYGQQQQQQTRTIYINSPSSSSQSSIEATGDNGGEQQQQQYIIVNSDGQETKLSAPSSYASNYLKSYSHNKQSIGYPFATSAKASRMPSIEDAAAVFSGSIDQSSYGNNVDCVDMCYSPENRWRKYLDHRDHRACCRTNSDDQQLSLVSAVDKSSAPLDSSDQYGYLSRRFRSRARRANRSRSIYQDHQSRYSNSNLDAAVEENGRPTRSNSYNSAIVDQYRSGRAGDKDDHDLDNKDSIDGPPASNYMMSSRPSRRSRRNRVRAGGDHDGGSYDSEQNFRQYEDLPTNMRLGGNNGESSNGESTSDVYPPETLVSRSQLSSGDNQKKLQQHESALRTLADQDDESNASGQLSYDQLSDSGSSGGANEEQRYPMDNNGDIVDQSSSLSKSSENNGETSFDSDDEASFVPAITTTSKQANNKHSSKSQQRNKPNQFKSRKMAKLQHGKDANSKSYLSPALNLKRKKFALDKLSSSSSPQKYSSDGGESATNSQDSINDGFQDGVSMDGQMDNGQQQQQQHTSKQTTKNIDRERAEKDSDDRDNRYHHISQQLANSSDLTSLSRTTSHLKELISLLEKKVAKSANNDSTSPPVAPTTTTTVTSTTTTTTPAPQQQQQQQLLLSNNPYTIPNMSNQAQFEQSTLLSDFTSSYKNPYSSSAAAAAAAMLSANGLTIPSAYSLPSALPETILSSQASPQSYHTATAYLTAASPANHHTHSIPRRRPRLNKQQQLRPYNAMHTIPTQSQSKAQYLGSTATILGSGKSHSIYYPSLQYPIWYRGAGGAGAHSVSPLRHLAKMGAAASHNQNSNQAGVISKNQGTIFDDSRQQSYDSLSSVASSLRPTAMRFIPTRGKSLIYQPHLLPIYTRHTILAQPMDIVK